MLCLLLLELVSKGEYQELPSAIKPIMLPLPPWEIELAKERENYMNICLCSHLQNNFQATNSKAARKTKFENKNRHTHKKFLWS